MNLRSFIPFLRPQPQPLTISPVSYPEPADPVAVGPGITVRSQPSWISGPADVPAIPPTPTNQGVIMFGFKSVAHAIATAAQDLYKGLKFVETNTPKLVAELQKANVAAPVIEATTQALVTAAAGPVAGASAVALERAAFAALGVVTDAATKVEAAGNAQFVNVQLDAAALADFKSVYAQVAEAVKASGVTK